MTRSARSRVPWLALLVAALACSESAPPAPPGASATFDLAIADRRVDVSAPAIRATAGQQLELRWQTDEPVVIHLHGYDVELALEPGHPGAMRFRADRTGRFPINVHRWGPDEGHAGHERAATGHADHAEAEHGHAEHDHAGEDDAGESVLLYLEVLPR